MQGRIGLIECLRGLAALAVAWFHLTNGYENTWVASLGAYGWLGVDTFFVISGFIIPYSLSKAYGDYSLSEFPHFLARRMIRLEPPYMASIILTIALWHLSTHFVGFRGASVFYEPRQVAAHLMYLIPATDYAWLQPVYWTLAYEFVFYIFIGAMYPIIFDPARSKIYRLMVLAALVAVAGGVLPYRSLLFVMGVAIFRGAGNRRGSKDELETFIVLIAAAFILSFFNMPAALTGFLIASMIYFFSETEITNRLGRGLFALGSISYSLYLVHVPIGGRIVNFGKRFVDEPWQELLLSTFALIAVLVSAVVFSKLIEQPFVNIARRLTRPRVESPISTGNQCG